MEGTGKWIGGGAIGLLGIFGLLAASRAADPAFLYGGWLVAIAAVVVLFLAIKGHYDRLERARAAEEHAEAGAGGAEAPKS